MPFPVKDGKEARVTGNETEGEDGLCLWSMEQRGNKNSLVKTDLENKGTALVSHRAKNQELEPKKRTSTMIRQDCERRLWKAVKPEAESIAIP